MEKKKPRITMVWIAIAVEAQSELMEGKPDMITYSCKSCAYRSCCPECSRRYPCKDYKRREPDGKNLRTALYRQRGI